jgi:hypothetical protein
MGRAPIAPAHWLKALAGTERREQETVALPGKPVIATEYIQMAEEARAEMSEEDAGIAPD